MPGFCEITFLPEGRIENFAGSRGNYYEFDDGSRLDMHTEPVWCHRCGCVAHGERVPTFDQMEKELADLDDPTSQLFKLTMRPLLPEFEKPGFREKFRIDRMAEQQKRLTWRRSRVSLPKCIRCGSTEIVGLLRDEPVVISVSPSPLSVVARCVGMCSTSFNEWFFTPEGDRIPRDTKPTYWHLPGVDKEAEKRWMQDFIKKHVKGDPRNPHG